MLNFPTFSMKIPNIGRVKIIMSDSTLSNDIIKFYREQGTYTLDYPTALANPHIYNIFERMKIV